MKIKPMTFSIFCILAVIGFVIQSWISLPELKQYPIHWNAAGKADGFAGRNAVLGVMMIMPATQIFMAITFYVLPKLEPLKQNFEDSQSAFHKIWIILMIFFSLMAIVLCLPYRAETIGDLSFSIAWISAAISLLFIGIGNVLGKVRQNYMLGIRTPWTLSSELSWEKTHRVGGRLFVFAGIIGLLLSIFISKAEVAIIGTVVIQLLTVIYCVIYSYQIWKNDPNKRV